MRKFLTLIICLSLAFTPFIVKAQSSQDAPVHHYYVPPRPKNAKLYYATGIIKNYGAGTSASGMCITLDSGKEKCFFTTINLRFNGVQDPCENFGICTNMPEGFVFGKTRVKVTYWYANDINGTNLTEVTDQVDSVK